MSVTLLCAFALASQTQPAIVRLESLDLSKMTQDWRSPGVNKSVDGHALVIAGKTYEHGVGTHAISDFTVDLAGQAERFEASVGVDGEMKSTNGTVVFEVWADNKKVADSGLMKGGMPAKRIDANLKGAKRMRLVVKDGGDGIDSDHADWVDAFIVLAPGASAANVRALSMPVEPPMPIAMGISPKPQINGARVVGCSPGKPFLFRVPASGQRPMSFAVTKGKLPAGIKLDPFTGILSGAVAQAGDTKFTVGVKGPKGNDSRDYTIVCGFHKLAMTPPMGWNSWNVWATSVDADKVRAAADAFVKTGLADAGYEYVNIDDAWEGKRDADGNIQTNEKFGNMAALADHVHSLGLKLGIYSGPGPRTCAGYEASYLHEVKDAQSYARWGIDYLKYDWCSYGELERHPDLAAMKKPYQVMRSALDTADRDIVYSLCQYGMGDVFKWGKAIGGNLWRTTGDITDTWQSLSDIAFAHSEKAVGVSPGGWNDPDMLVVGYLGWGPNPRPTRLKPNEQITHITMWSMLAAPLIIGCDLNRLDAFTKALLMNHDVIEIDQDPLGKAATRRSANGQLEVWARPLWDGTTAVALFNRGPEKAPITASWKPLGLRSSERVRDLWQNKDLGSQAGGITRTVPAHGAMMFKVG